MRNLWLLFLVGLATGFISENVFVSSQSPSSTADDLYLEGQTSGDPIDIDEGKDDGLPIDDEDGGEDYGSGSGSGDYDLMDQDEKLMRFVNLSITPVFQEKVPSQPQPTTDSPHNPPATTADSQYPLTTKDIEKIEVPDVDSRGEEEASIDPAGDYVKPSNSDDNMPTSKTTPTEFTIDDSVNTDTDEDNSLDVWDVSTPRNSGDEVQIQEIEKEIVAKDGRGSRIYEMDSPKEVTSENLWERTEVLAAVIACGVVGFLCAVFLLLLLAYRMKKKDEGSYDLGDTKLSTAQYHKAPTKEFYA